MDKFWEALRESTIGQFCLTVGVWAAIIALVLTNREVPELLGLAGTSILGYWFGVKNQYQLSQVRKNLTEQFLNQDTRGG